MLHLILGRSGSGKTFTVRQELCRLAKEGLASRCICLVPEQFSFETERALLRELGPRDASAVRVYSFSRLAEMVQKELGGCAGRLMDDATRVLLMSEALTQVGDRLTVYRRRAAGEAQVQSMLRFVQECKQGGITPAALEAAAGETEGALQGKLRDLSLVLGAYEALGAQAYVDPQDALSSLYERLPESGLVRDTLIFADGFKGFTAEELRVLGGLMSEARELTVTLCADTLQQEAGTELFATPMQTAAQLLRLAQERQVPAAPVRYLTENHRHRTEGLRYLESAVLRGETAPLEAAAPEVTVTEYSDLYRECVGAAHTLHRLMREGFRCRDMAVVVRSPERYRGMLDMVLEQAEIPYYRDAREDIRNDTLTVTLLSALRCLIGNYRAEDVLRLVKTGLLRFSAHTAAQLENYVLLWNVQGAAWKRPWTEHPDGLSVRADAATDRRLAYLNLLRRRIMRPLLQLEQALGAHPTGTVFARALYEYLIRAHVDRMVRFRVLRLEAAGEAALAERADRLWDTVMGLLDRFAAALGPAPGDTAHFTELLAQAAGVTDLGTIPQQLDAVQVGAADRMRFSSPRAVLLLGAEEGVFPAVPSEADLLSDRERQALRALQLPVAEASESRLTEERFFVYAALSAPSERLFVSYSTGGPEGETRTPSVIVQEIRTLLPGHTHGDPDGEPEYGEEMFARFSESWREPDVPAVTLRQVLGEHPAYAGRLRRLEQAAVQRERRFETPDAARRLFGDFMTLSPTRVEDFYQCRFRYFCRYGMRAMPPKQADLNALEFGKVLHDIMQRQLPSYVEEGVRQITRARAEEDAARCIRQYVGECMGGLEQKPARFLYLLSRMERFGGQLLWQVVQELRQSRFVPVDYELPLTVGGEPGSVLAEVLTLPDGGRVCVVGTVDRVDVYRDGDTSYVRVVDYKTGSKEFRLQEVVEGLNLQMLIYMGTLWQNGGPRYGTVTPAGMLYLPSKLPVVEAEAHADAAELAREQLRCMRMKGLLLDNPAVLEAMEADVAGVFIPAKQTGKGTLTAQSSVASLRQLGLLKQRTEELLREMASALREGEIAAVPTETGGRTACQYCDYRAVCGYEDGDRTREIASRGRAEVLQDLEESRKHSDGEEAEQP